MRRILCSYALLSLAVFAGDGRTPRGSAAEYPAHQDVKRATIAAVRVSAEQLNTKLPRRFRQEICGGRGRHLSERWRTQWM